MGFKPTDEDERLWSHITKNVERMEEGDFAALFQTQEPIKPAREPTTSAPLTIGKKPLAPPPTPPVPRESVQEIPQLNKRDEARLRKGQMEIEGTIDLHGLSQEQAFLQLRRFILSAVHQGKRCVLVITGKGRLSKPSVIKSNLPEWLHHPDIRSHVLKSVPAQAKDGGGGAFYVYLKRNKAA